MTRTWLLQHPFMKLLSLIMAFLLWFVVHGEQEVEVNADVRVEIEDLPEDLVLLSEEMSEVKVRVSGPRTLLQQIKDRGFRYPLNLTNASVGARPYYLYAEDLKIPRRAQVRRFSPEFIRLELDRALQRRLRVMPRFIGELEKGFEMVEEKIEPGYVTVRGPARKMKELDSLRTEAISLAGRQTSFAAGFNVETPAGIQVDPTTVTARIEIREKEVSETIENIPVVVSGVDGKVVVVPSTLQLQAKGPATKVASLAEEGVQVAIDGSSLGLSRRRRNVRVSPEPPNYPGVEITLVPNRVLVKLVD